MAREDEQRRTRDTQSLVMEQRSLLDQMREFQQHQARTQFDAGRRDLREQLRTQREDIAQGRRTLAEQAHMAQRQIREGAGARGLGSSGMKNLAALQSQMEQGRATTDLERTSSDLTRAGMLQQQSMREALTSQLMQSELGYAQGQLDTSKAERDWGMEDIGVLMDLMQMGLGEGESFSEEQIGMLSDMLFGADYEIGDTPVSELIKPTGPTEGLQAKDNFSLLKEMLGPTSRLPDFVTGNLVRLIAGKELRSWKESEGLVDLFKDPDKRTYTYFDGGKEVKMTGSEAVSKAEERLSKAGVGDKVVVSISSKGVLSFKYNGKSYNDINKAIDKAKGK